MGRIYQVVDPTRLRARREAVPGGGAREVGPEVFDTAVGPQDLFFFLRRPGREPSHLWRLFRSRYDARGFLGRRYPGDPRVDTWMAALPYEDFDALVAGGPGDAAPR